jgi:cysteinyl-tRNA synthetase
LQQDAEAWFRWTPAGSSGPTDAEIETAIAARQAARKAKDFKESDRIRDELKANRRDSGGRRERHDLEAG